MLISFLALVALVNARSSAARRLAASAELSDPRLRVRVPLALVDGRAARRTPSSSATCSGTRTVLNEFIAYSQLGPLKATLDPRSFTIATYALCGFANFSSIGIQIGGIGALGPERRERPRAGSACAPCSPAPSRTS